VPIHSDRITGLGREPEPNTRATTERGDGTNDDDDDARRGAARRTNARTDERTERRRRRRAARHTRLLVARRGVGRRDDERAARVALARVGAALKEAGADLGALVPEVEPVLANGWGGGE